MTSIIEDASYHKQVILHCAFCVLMTRFQLTFFSNCITITIITINNIYNYYYHYDCYFITIITINITIITLNTIILLSLLFLLLYTIITVAITIIYHFYYNYYYYYIEICQISNTDFERATQTSSVQMRVRSSLRAYVLSLENLNVIIRAIN